jgi:glucose-1-phosphate cytidylyltransferase
MQLVILAGGLGTRLSEETTVKPKPMLEIGNMPIMWHIMKHYSSFGVRDFIICGGYKINEIKSFFIHYHALKNDLHINLASGLTENLNNVAEDWNVKVIDTGEDTSTGGRLLRIREHLTEPTFYMTYGDGVSNVDIANLLSFHQNHESLVTVTAVKPKGRYGALELYETEVRSFQEKLDNKDSWVNGGYFVIDVEALNFVSGEDEAWEKEPLSRLSEVGQVTAFKHEGFWQSMDTARDKDYLNSLWQSGERPWITWN